jgi:hypothetical protein
MYSHKMQGRETLSRSHNNLNTTDDHTGTHKSFLHPPSYGMGVREFKNFGFEISLD